MRRGFTLLEAIIAISLLGLVGLSFSYLISLSQRMMIQSMDASTSQGDAAFALEHIRRYVATATDITVPAEGASGPALEFTWQQGGGGVVTNHTSRYELGGTDGTDLRFTRDVGGPFEVVSRRIQDITFDRAVARMVSVNVTARKTTGGDSRDTQLQTNISPRGLF